MLTPMAMRFWLFRRARTANEDVLPGRASGRIMSYESLEHVVRSRVRMFLRHTWLVTILGTLLLGATVWAAIHFTIARDYMRIAAGPLDARFVHALSNQLATDHRYLHLQIVPTTSPQATAEAMSKGEADLAVLPSQLDNARDGPVVPILRQNVMALIAPRRARRKWKRARLPSRRRRRAPKAVRARAARVRAQRQAARTQRAVKARNQPKATPVTTATANSAKSPIFQASASASSAATKRPRACSNWCSAITECRATK